MLYFSVDPGSEKSAYIIYESTEKKIIFMGIVENHLLLNALAGLSLKESSVLLIETLECFGMPVGESVIETAIWIGRFIQAATGFKEIKRIKRTDIKLELCLNRRAKDSNIRQRLIDIWGKPGTKKKPGRIYGIKKDLWSALAILTYELGGVYEK